MRFTATADSDVGTVKKTNQDSLLVKHALTNRGEVLMAIICDGMGGLQNGELASATVIRCFEQWFNEILPERLKNPDMPAIGREWSDMLVRLNQQLMDYSLRDGSSMGTTFSGIIFIEDQYIIAHVGDSRVYYLGSSLCQLTKDQTFIAREIERGTMTPEMARTDKRRNLLLQCVGASPRVEPQIILAQARQGAYMLCSDGFRHEISGDEIYNCFKPRDLFDKELMHNRSRFLIEQVKQRGERDNISVILIKAE